ncbi:hypothetical protein ILUMI_22944, partial [Ignelater luminosus]
TIRQNAKDLHDTPAQIVAQNLQCVSAATQGVMPGIHTMKRTIRKIQAGTGNTSIQHTREDINLTISFQEDAKENDFLLYDLGASGDRIMIFATEVNLRFLSACNTWLVDGTFKVSPSLFDQVFVIHGYRSGSSFPLLYCLASTRTEPLQHTPEFSRAVYRKMQSLPEVLHQCSNDPEFAYQIRQLNALAFIPPDDVQLVYDVLMDEPFFMAHGMQTLLAEFTTYFELIGVKSKDYHNKIKRNQCYKNLIAKVKEIDPASDRAMIANKTNNLRITFHKKHKKVVQSKITGTGTNDVYVVPKLRYYDHLQFLVNQEMPMEASSSIANSDSENDPAPGRGVIVTCLPATAPRQLESFISVQILMQSPPTLFHKLGTENKEIILTAILINDSRPGSACGTPSLNDSAVASPVSRGATPFRKKRKQPLSTSKKV